MFNFFCIKKETFKIALLYVLFFLLSIINSFFIFRNPWIDWDIVSYIGNVKYIENKDIKVIHKETYKELEKHLDPLRYEMIKGHNSYRVEVFSSPKAFYDIMPFYSIKFIYVYSIYFFSKIFGISVFYSVLAISIISYVIFSSILFAIFKEELVKNPFYIFPLYLLTFSPPIIIAARSTTPDMLSAMFLLLGTFLIIKKKLLWGIPILILSLGIRTDNVIFVLLLLFYLKFFSGKDYKIKTSLFLVSGLATVLFYKGINLYFDNFGYWKLYYNSFIEPIPYPSSFEVSINYKQYLSILKDKIALLLGLRENKPITFFPFYIILSMIAHILASRNKIGLNNVFLGILVVSTLTLIFKFSIFPNIQERYFVFHFIIIFIVLVKFVLGDRENSG